MKLQNDPDNPLHLRVLSGIATVFLGLSLAKSMGVDIIPAQLQFLDNARLLAFCGFVLMGPLFIRVIKARRRTDAERKL